MDTVGMNNILHNLTNLEQSFLEINKGQLSFIEYETYREFLDNYFIKKHMLKNIYWPQVRGTVPKFITEQKQLDEAFIIFSGLSFAISKQINFPSTHVHSGNFYEVVYIYEGTGTLDFAGRRFNLVAGDFFIKPPNTQYLLNTEGSSIGINIMIRRKYFTSECFHLFNHNLFMLSFMNRTLINSKENNYILFHTRTNDNIAETILHILIEYLWGDEHKNVIMESYLQLLFSFLIRYKKSDLEANSFPSNIEINYNDICSYLRRNFRYATLASTSGYLHFSKQYIDRIVRQMSGNNFTALLTDIKLQKAKSYLLDTNLKIEDIAEFTGFSDASHLSNVFKTKAGIPPSKYRQNNLGRVKKSSQYSGSGK